MRDRKTCVLSRSLSEILAELECMYYYSLLLLFRIHLILLLQLLLLLLLLLSVIYYYYLQFYIVSHLAKRKKIAALPTM